MLRAAGDRSRRRPAARGVKGQARGDQLHAEEGRDLILIVDDDFDFLEINRIILEGAGYAVATATNPDEARTRIDEQVPDLIITDLMMDSLDAGFQFSSRLKDDPRTAEVPIIISTSVSSALGLDFSPRSNEDLEKMRVDAYFDKPLDGRALLAKVAELLGRET